jgi:hypothetical protein
MPRKPNAEAPHTMLYLKPEIKGLLIALSGEHEHSMSRVVTDALLKYAGVTRAQLEARQYALNPITGHQKRRK